MKLFTVFIKSLLIAVLLTSCGGGVGGGDKEAIENPYAFDEDQRSGSPTNDYEDNFLAFDGETALDVVDQTQKEEQLDIENADGSLELIGTEWVLTSYIPAGKEKQLAEPKNSGRRHTLNFTQEEIDLSEEEQASVLSPVDQQFSETYQLFSGFMGCNNFGGESLYEHPVLALSNIRITNDNCAGPPMVPSEQFVLNILFNQDPLNVSFIDNRLILTHPSGNQLIYGPPGATDAPTGPVGDSCLTFSSNILNFGDVGLGDWDQWYEPFSLRYALRYDEVANVIDQYGDTYIRTRLKPTPYGSTHVQSGARLPAGRTYLVSQNVMFETGFDWGGTHEGGKFGFGLGTEKSVSGGSTDKDGFTLRFMWRGNYDGTARIAAYSYASDRFDEYPNVFPYGADYPIPFTIPVGEWFALTMEVTANSNIDASDGVIRIWVNGDLALTKTGIQWQAEGGVPELTRLSFANFHGGNNANWSPARTSYIRFKDVCLTGS